MQFIAYTIFILYACCMVFILLFCLMQLHLLFLYLNGKKNTTYGHNPAPPMEWPCVTVQLPVYNERYVVERLIASCCALDYPTEKLHIQVLDDSTDETRELAAQSIDQFRAKGIDIVHVTRNERSGYKAGALQYGLSRAKGEFIAIFDADFLPPATFLKNVIPAFKQENIAAVQTRWGHLNENYSLITRLQALPLNLHFSVEQSGRQYGDYFLQFNGTAGVWRQSAILDAGGWQSDTLTEDLDLSYRAQLRGWKIRYLEEIGTPAELPVLMPGLKSQQFRWMKGGAETARKLLPEIWRSGLPVMHKLHATIHLLSSSVFFSVFFLGILSVPMSFLVDYTLIPAAWMKYALLITLIVAWVYYTGNVSVRWRPQVYAWKFLQFFLMFPLFLTFSMGLSLHNTRAVCLGFAGKRSAFVRTPKFNILKQADRVNDARYISSRVTLTTVIEGLLCLYFLVAIIIGLVCGNLQFIIFHLMLMTGYGTIFYYSLRHSLAR